MSVKLCTYHNIVARGHTCTALGKRLQRQILIPLSDELLQICPLPREMHETHENAVKINSKVVILWTSLDPCCSYTTFFNL